MAWKQFIQQHKIECVLILAVSSYLFFILTSLTTTVNSELIYEQKDPCSHFCFKNDSKAERQISVNTCKMLCLETVLWPKPKSIKQAFKTSSIISKSQINFAFNVPTNANVYIKKASEIFLKNLKETQEENYSDLKIIIKIESDSLSLVLNTNESYNLTIAKNGDVIEVDIESLTFFGSRHGLETLSQLIWYDEIQDSLHIFDNVSIEDSPSFPYRGIMIDTARNFFPMELIYKVIEGMAASKLNVLHLHLTDTQSFPIVLPSLPILAKYGSYSSEMRYTAADIEDLSDFAIVRGIRIILEIDAPGHINEGWKQANPKLVTCTEDITKGQLNPDEEEGLIFLEKIYDDLLRLNTNREMFHIGGDEVDLKCWKNTESAKKFDDLQDLWINYTNRMIERLKKANRDQVPENIILWSSPLTSRGVEFLEFKENLVVQFWYEGDPISFLEKGFKTIFSTVAQWYLDCGFGPWKPGTVQGTCDPYKHWQVFYNYTPWSEYFFYKDQILGGEACLWSEQVEVFSLQTRIWPRAAAFAERLWSDPEEFTEFDVFSRLAIQRERLVSRGLEAEALWPRWCTNNPGRC